MFDTHVHLFKEFYDLPIRKILEFNKMKGIIGVVSCADSIRTCKETVLYVEKYWNHVYGAVGIHPQNIDEFSDENLKIVENLAKTKGIVAIGEIGLDYYYKPTEEEKTKQKELFEKQIQLAAKLNLPIIVHTRNAIEDTYKIISKYNVKGVIHCYSGSVEMAKKFINKGFLLGISGIVTFKNSKLYKVVQEINIENILLETDGPFLAPEPVRGTVNTSKNLIYIALKIAKIKNMKLEDVVTQTTYNADRIFDLGIRLVV